MVPDVYVVKAPTPIKDDFYTRRLKDSDRRSSLGPKDLTPGSFEPNHLYRSTSRSSIRSSSSSSRYDPFLSSSVMTATAKAGPSTYQQDQTPPSLPPPLYPLSRQTSATSTSLPTSSTVRGHGALHRTVSNLSGSSRSRRESISDRVSGFFSKLLRRESSLSGPGSAEADPAELSGSKKNEIGADDGVAQVESANEVSQRTQRSSLDHEREEDVDQPDNEEAVEEDVLDEEFEHIPDIASHINTYNKYSGPKLRLPPPLTRPAPRQLTTATRALQPKKTILTNNNSSGDVRTRPAAALKAPLVASGPSKPLTTVRPPRPATSSFTARALSRLPAPGKGSTSSARPTIIRNAERAADLQAKKDRYELLAKQASDERQKALSAYSSRPTSGLKRTIPLSGSTPGRVSRQRAEERARFEKGLRERHEEKERRDEEVRRAKEEMEVAEERVRRGERVVWAKEVPEMYRREKC